MDKDCFMTNVQNKVYVSNGRVTDHAFVRVVSRSVILAVGSKKHSYDLAIEVTRESYMEDVVAYFKVKNDHRVDPIYISFFVFSDKDVVGIVLNQEPAGITNVPAKISSTELQTFVDNLVYLTTVVSGSVTTFHGF